MAVGRMEATEGRCWEVEQLLAALSSPTVDDVLWLYVFRSTELWRGNVFVGGYAPSSSFGGRGLFIGSLGSVTRCTLGSF